MWGGQRHLRAVDEEARIAVNRAGAQEEAVHGVVLEQVLHVLRSHRRVDVLEDERLAVDGNAHDLAADAAEAVDAELDRQVGAIRLGSTSSLLTCATGTPSISSGIGARRAGIGARRGRGRGDRGGRGRGEEGMARRWRRAGRRVELQGARAFAGAAYRNTRTLAAEVLDGR